MQIFEIPIKPVPSQKLSVMLGAQNTTIELAWKNNRLYATVSIGSIDVVCSRLCLNREPIVREQYRGFIGELYFDDQQGSQEPDFVGLGSRYKLFWVTK